MTLLRINPKNKAANLPALRLLPMIEDRSFLPAAVGIVETPASPIHTALMLTVCAFATAALAWSWFGRIDVLATARGKIEPLGHVKVVQPLDPGKVLAVWISDGQAVKAGDILIELDRHEAEADLQGAREAETAAEAEAIRRAAAIQTLRSECWTCDIKPGWTDRIPALTRTREEAVLHSDVHEVSATLSNVDDQQREKAAAVQQASLTIDAEKRLIQTLNERVSMKDELVRRNAGTKAGVIDATQSLREAEATLANDLGKKQMADAALASLRSERDKTLQGFLADQTRKMVDARRTADQRGAERAKAQARLDHMTLKAPVDGTVQSLGVTTTGQVVTTGQELMRITPRDEPLQIQAYLPEEDIGFVKSGQEAVVKVDAFPFTLYGTVGGRVARVSQDAIPTENANQVLVDRSRSNDSQAQSLTPSAKPMSNLVFETEVKLDRPDLMINGQSTPLTPGMTVSVEVKTGSRRILEYLFSPLMEVSSTAMRER